MSAAHKLPDVLTTDLDIIFVGTAAGQASADRGILCGSRKSLLANAA